MEQHHRIHKSSTTMLTGRRERRASSLGSLCHVWMGIPLSACLPSQQVRTILTKLRRTCRLYATGQLSTMTTWLRS
eukprot:764754-Hanusia_phi.AAC.3